jgi:hypothetical protein
VLTKVYVSAQVALPDWARGRGLAIFLGVDAGAEGLDALVDALVIDQAPAQQSSRVTSRYP